MRTVSQRLDTTFRKPSPSYLESCDESVWFVLGLETLSQENCLAKTGYNIQKTLPKLPGEL
jgi:hypothetical protein